jgi:two-component system, NarL family, response regulator NreC
MLRIILADDHHVVRQGCRVLLEREGLDIVGEAAEGREAVELAKAHAPDVVVLDLSMPGLNGLDAAREILKACPRTQIVLLTMHAEESQILAAVRAGIRGYVVKTRAAGELVAAIRQVAAGSTYLSTGGGTAVAGASLPSLDPPAIAPRERLVLQLIAQGKTNRELAVALGVSTKTAETYRGRLMRKLDVRNTAGLVRYAVRHGFIEAAFAGWAIFNPFVYAIN